MEHALAAAVKSLRAFDSWFQTIVASNGLLCKARPVSRARKAI
jgi:hypothetical protein